MSVTDSRARGAQYARDSANRLTGVSGQSSVFSYQYNGSGDRMRQVAGGITMTYTLDLNAGPTQVMAGKALHHAGHLAEGLREVATQLKQNFRKILLAVITPVLVALAACILQSWSLTNTRGRLMENPKLPPPYISAIAPFPGSEYPTDSYSSPYWHEVRDESGICIRVDARIIVPDVIDYEEAFRVVPFDSVQLSLNGKLVGDIEDIWPNGKRRFVKRGGFPSTIENPQNLEELYFPDHVPINFCWRVNLPPSLYLAEASIRAQKSGTLRYQWAFQVVAP